MIIAISYANTAFPNGVVLAEIPGTNPKSADKDGLEASRAFWSEDILLEEFEKLDEPVEL